MLHNGLISVLLLVLTGCALAGKQVSPRHVDCRAECTQDRQFVECKGISEGTKTQEMTVKGQ